jgi:hypothetical protein
MRKLDTSKLGPIRVTPEPFISQRSRDLYATELASRGYPMAADSVRTGGYGNIWTVAALAAIERASRVQPDDE